MRNRPWVEKFESGEYLYKWKNYSPILIGGSYFDGINIGEDKFTHCVNFFSGVGDVDWWISEELDKLSVEEEIELEYICKYKTYLQEEVLSHEMVGYIAGFYGCEKFHIFRTGNKEIINMINHINDFRSLIVKSSKSCRDQKTIDFNNIINKFKILTFEEYKDTVKL